MKLLPISFAALVVFAVSSPLTAEQEGPRVSVHTTGVGQMGKCDSKVSRSVSVCDGLGSCRSQDLADEVSFRMPRNGSFTLSASTSIVEDGVVQGSGVSDRFSTQRGRRDLVQTLDASPSCSFAFSYDIDVH